MTGPLDKNIEINGIKFDAIGWFPIALRERGDAIVLTVQLADGEYTGSQVSECLVGATLSGHKIRGVEMFAVEQQTDKTIGILI